VADHSKIEWTEATWNPLAGCTAVSPGCDHCYAAALASGRLAHTPVYGGLADGGAFNGTIRLLPERLDQPLRWRRPRRIFVNSMSDLFHEGVSNDYVVRVFAVMALASQHVFQVLTKRHARMRALLNSVRFRIAVLDAIHLAVNGEIDGITVPRDAVVDHRRRVAALLAGNYDAELPWPLTNVWLGVSVEDQHWADIRIPALVDTPTVVRWVSAEPLLGPVDFYSWLVDHGDTDRPWGIPLDWVVTGGESGPDHRPADLDWFRAIRDQCVDAGIAYLHKQNGGRTSKSGGRELDGRTWDEYPTNVMSPSGRT
jgi:protein gp37